MSATATDDRFWSKVEGDDPLGCWLWTGAAPSGYGTFYAGGGVSVYAHRYAYTAMVGPIPDGLHLDHTCQTPRCVNPLHLDPVTPRVNAQRAGRSRVYKAPTPVPEGLDLLTLKQYAAAIGKSTRTVQRWLAEGIITSDQKLSTPTGDHLFRADREEVLRTGASNA